MSYKLEYNPTYEQFLEPLQNIQSYFASSNNTIHQARNEIKIAEILGEQTVIKAYKVPNFLNRFVYAHIRKSKPYKAFHYAMRLKKLGVSTPEPIGYIEFYENSLLKESYFLSKYFLYDFTMAHIRDDQPSYKEEVLIAFSRFTHFLHTKGVWHSDYSGGNILVKKAQDSYEFSIVDINRMKFINISGYAGLKNFNKLWFNKEDLTIIAKEYAKLEALNEKKAIALILHHDQKLKNKVEFKRKLRGK